MYSCNWMLLYDVIFHKDYLNSLLTIPELKEYLRTTLQCHYMWSSNTNICRIQTFCSLGSLKNWSGSLSCKTWFLKPIKIRLNPKDEHSILKIERVTILFVTQPEAKISIKRDFQISKSRSVFEIWVQFFASELNS